MPVVPTPQRRVQPAGLPAPRLTSNVPQAAIGVPSGGLDLSAVRDQAIRIGQEEKQKANQIQLTDAGGKLTSKKTEIGVRMVSQKGQNAFTAVETAREEFDTASQEIEDGLGSDELKITFQRMKASAWNEINNQGQYHVAAEREAYDKNSTAAFVIAQQNDAITNYTNPQIVESSIAAQKVALQYRGQRAGLSPEQIKYNQDQAVSETRMGVLTGFVNTGEDVTAEAYFKQHEKEFIGDDYARAQKLQQEGSVEGQAQRQSDAILARSKSWSEAMKLAADVPPGRIRTEVERRIELHYERLDREARRENEEAYRMANESFERIPRYSAIPLSVRLKLTQSQKDQFQRDEKEKANPTVKTDRAVWGHLNNLAHLNDATRDEFLRINLDREYRDKLSDTDYKHFKNLQDEIREGPRGDRALMGRQERLIIDQAQAVEEYRVLTPQEKKAYDKKFGGPPTISAKPQWMVDSIAARAEYADYLRSFSVPVGRPQVGPTAPGALPPTSRSPVPLTPVPQTPEEKAEAMTRAGIGLPGIQIPKKKP